MIRPTSSILLLLAAAAGGALFHISFEVSELDDRLAHLNRDIRSDREAIHVLRAEWSFLNQPERLEELARRHLDLMPVVGNQLAGAGTLPVRPESELDTRNRTVGPDGLGTEIVMPTALPGALPKAKPAAPARPAVIPVVADAAPAPQKARSLDDVLREIVRDDARTDTAGGR